jgi:hypothetical protein
MFPLRECESWGVEWNPATGTPGPTDYRWIDAKLLMFASKRQLPLAQDVEGSFAGAYWKPK